ncbi:MAG: hypothetical protein ABSH15_10225 [Verrucomicrobiota bacterium]|jgi:hypothetical protein
MAEPEQEPSEKKLSPWRQFIEDASWDIPGARALGNLFLAIFVLEGKAVKNGWIAFLVFTVCAFWGGCHYSEQKIDSKLAGITNYFSVELNKRNFQISELKEQIADAKQDRDKYQMMLAPFQAAALKIYTNEPLNQRLDLLATEMGNISKQVNVILRINDNENLVMTDVPIGTYLTVSNQIAITNGQIRLGLINKSKYPAINSFVDFAAGTDSTNLILIDWAQQPAEPGGGHWRYSVEKSIPHNHDWHISTIMLSTNFTKGRFWGRFDVGADNSETKTYYVDFFVNIGQ